MLYQVFGRPLTSTGGPNNGAVSACISSSCRGGWTDLSSLFLELNGCRGIKDSASASISAKAGSAMMSRRGGEGAARLSDDDQVSGIRVKDRCMGDKQCRVRRHCRRKMVTNQ